MPGLQTQTPWQLVLDLLVQNPDAASALSEASHGDKLTFESAEAVGQSERERQAARHHWEHLQHKLDPRSRRQLNIRVGIVALALTAGGLLWLSLLELSGAAGRKLPLALCATVIFLTAAWRAALAAREGEARLAALISGGAAGLGLLLVAVHLFASWPAHPRRVAGNVLALVLIVALTVGARAVISRTEPVVVAAARGNWRQAERRYRQAARQYQQDASQASGAIEAWLDMARRHAIEVQQNSGRNGGEKFVEEVVAAAAALYVLGRPSASAALR